MLRFDQPPEPENFAAAVRAARAKIESLRKKGPPKSKDFDDVWRRYRKVLYAAQRKKCGYCEQKLGTSPEHLEHYRPKAALQELPEDTSRWGHELEDSSKVPGRKLDHFSDWGYWWLAYEWTNYLVACERCNSGWKQNLFPVAENPRPDPPRPDLEETPLLLSPYGDQDPADHLSFDNMGFIKARHGSPYGEATIHTCGLDRPSLIDSRLEKARGTFQLVREYEGASSTAERKKTLIDFVEKGDEKYHHAGMVRAIFKQEIGLPWDEVEDWIGQSDE